MSLRCSNEPAHMFLAGLMLFSTFMDTTALRHTTISSAECSARCSKAYAVLLQPGNPKTVAFYWGASMIITLLTGINPNTTNPFRLAQHKLEMQCESLSEHDQCYHIAAHRSCGNRAGALMKKLHDISRETVLRLSRMPELSSSLPNSCLVQQSPSRDSNVEFLRTSCAVSGCAIAHLSAVLLLSLFRLC